MPIFPTFVPIQNIPTKKKKKKWSDGGFPSLPPLFSPFSTTEKTGALKCNKSRNLKSRSCFLNLRNYDQQLLQYFLKNQPHLTENNGLFLLAPTGVKIYFFNITLCQITASDLNKLPII